MTPILLALVFSCDRAEPTAKAPADPTAPTAKLPSPPLVDPPAPVPAGCAALTRAECLVSSDCTLHHRGGNHYECRADTGPCETGIRQEDQKGCEAQAACAFVSANCYCMCPSPGVTPVPDVIPKGSGCGCACGGGPPSMCVERTATK